MRFRSTEQKYKINLIYTESCHEKLKKLPPVSMIFSRKVKQIV